MTPEQRRYQLGRIHGAARILNLSDGDYRDLLEQLTGLRSCSDMDDRQLNHVMDWLAWMTGTRRQRPAVFGRYSREMPGAARVHLVRMAHAMTAHPPAGYETSPIRSPAWRLRTCGSGAEIDDLTADQLVKLIEGAKAIAGRPRRAGR